MLSIHKLTMHMPFIVVVPDSLSVDGPAGCGCVCERLCQHSAVCVCAHTQCLCERVHIDDGNSWNSYAVRAAIRLGTQHIQGDLTIYIYLVRFPSRSGSERRPDLQLPVSRGECVRDSVWLCAHENASDRTRPTLYTQAANQFFHPNICQWFFVFALDSFASSVEYLLLVAVVCVRVWFVRVPVVEAFPERTNQSEPRNGANWRRNKFANCDSQ